MSVVLAVAAGGMGWVRLEAMTDRVPGYARPQLAVRDGKWHVWADPWGEYVGTIEQHRSGWTAHISRGRYGGLWPDKRAAAEALVKQAGYELLP